MFTTRAFCALLQAMLNRLSSLKNRAYFVFSRWKTNSVEYAGYLANRELVSRNRKLRTLAGKNGVPLPPPRLIYLVSGRFDLANFIDGGAESFGFMTQALQQSGYAVESFESILDFGCGCGRMTRHWLDRCDPKRFSLCGTDINYQLVNWCKRNIPFGRFDLNQLIPKLQYSGEQFDFIYAFSVFTHLPEDMQIPWLLELRRVLKPGGILYLTLHDRYDWLTTEQEKRFKTGFLVIQSAVHAGSNACNAYHPPEYVRREFSKHLEILFYSPGGTQKATKQSAWVFKKR